MWCWAKKSVIKQVFQVIPLQIATTAHQFGKQLVRGSIKKKKKPSSSEILQPRNSNGFGMVTSVREFQTAGAKNNA
jgi:hypothetical protein